MILLFKFFKLTRKIEERAQAKDFMIKNKQSTGSGGEQGANFQGFVQAN